MSSTLRLKLRPLTLLAAALLAMCSATARANDTPKRALLLVKALSYERRLTETKGASVGVSVLYAASNNASKQAALSWVKSFESLGNLKLDGAPIQATATAYDANRLSEQIRRQGVDVLLACDGTPFAGVTELAREHAILSAADTRSGLDKLSLGVFLEGEKPRIVINMKAAKAEGAKFSAKLLQLADLI